MSHTDELAVGFVASGKFEDAISVFDAMLALDSGRVSAAGFTGKALLLSILQRHQELLELLGGPAPKALSQFERTLIEGIGRESRRRLGLSRVPAAEDEITNLFGLGMDAARAEMWQKCDEQFAAVLDRDPDRPLAWNNKAHARMELGQYAHAFVLLMIELARTVKAILPGVRWAKS